MNWNVCSNFKWIPNYIGLLLWHHHLKFIHCWFGQLLIVQFSFALFQMQIKLTDSRFQLDLIMFYRFRIISHVILLFHLLNDFTVIVLIFVWWKHISTCQQALTNRCCHFHDNNAWIIYTRFTYLFLFCFQLHNVSDIGVFQIEGLKRMKFLKFLQLKSLIGGWVSHSGRHFFDLKTSKMMYRKACK